eukprot:g2500.t1
MQSSRSALFGRSVSSVCFSSSVTSRRSISIEAAVKKTSLRNIICSKTLKVKEGSIEDAKRLCKGIAEHAISEMKDPSRGIISFEVFQDPHEEKQIHFFERYLDNTRMGQFNTSDEFQKFMTEIQDYLEEPVGLVLYEYKKGQLGAVCVQGGPKGEGGLDDATGAGGKGASTNPKAPEEIKTETLDGEDEPEEEKDEERGFFGLPFEFKFPWENS